MWLAIVLAINAGHDLMYGPAAAYFSELFPPHVRYSGASLVYQVSSVISGGFAPLIATWLMAHHGIGAVAGYLAVLCLVSIVSVWLAPETHRSAI